MASGMNARQSALFTLRSRHRVPEIGTRAKDSLQPGHWLQRSALASSKCLMSGAAGGPCTVWRSRAIRGLSSHSQVDSLIAPPRSLCCCAAADQSRPIERDRATCSRGDRGNGVRDCRAAGRAGRLAPGLPSAMASTELSKAPRASGMPCWPSPSSVTTPSWMDGFH